MSLNINVTTRRRQLAILVGIIIVGSAVAAGVVMWGGEGNGSKNAAPAPVPNMTGVVTAAFDEQVNQSALQQQQAKTSAIENQITQLTQMVSQNKLDFDTKLQKKDAEIQRLTEQLNDARSGKTTPPATQAAPDGTPLPGPVSAGQARPPQYSVTPANGTQYPAGAVNPNQGAGFYPSGSGNRLSGGMTTQSFTYASRTAARRERAGGGRAR